MRKLLSLLDLSSDEFVHILDQADCYHDYWKANAVPQVLKNKQVGLWFFGQGFRNRVAFEIGAQAMGATVSYIPGDIGVHEPLEDMGRYLDNWFSILVVRAQRHNDLRALAESTDAAVVNARTNYNHPCEIVGDLQYIRRYRGSLEGLSLVFVGEVANMCMTWFEAAMRLPISVTQVAPAGYELDKTRIDEMNRNAAGRISVSHELEPLLLTADVLYTDSWPKTQNEEEARAVRALFKPYQITSTHLSKLREGAIFLPCPPVTRGQEVSQDAMLSDVCKNHEAKQFLLHSQNAILEFAVNA